MPAIRGAAGAAVSRTDVKKSLIIEGARSVFLRSGFEGTSMDAVAAEAGVSKMTVYRHYGSKEALFAGVIAALCERIVDDDLQLVFNRPPEQALRLFARKMIDIVFDQDTIELHRIVVAESRRFPKLGRLFYASGPQACIEALQRYFRDHSSDRQFKVTQPRQAAEQFLELLRGYDHLRIMLGIQATLGPAEIERRIDGAVRHVLAVPKNQRMRRSRIPGRLQ